MSNEGPLSKLMRGLGLDADLAPIEAVKRIEQRPVKVKLPDIYECRACGYQFPQEATCPQCDSTNMRLFMRAPARGEIRHDKTDREAELTELDPDWRERFLGDVDRAWDFYKPRPTFRVIHSSPFEPPDYKAEPYRDPDED